MKTLSRILVLFAFFVSASLVSRAEDVKVYAAASLTDAMQAIAAAYGSQSQDKIVFNFAGSNVLARQILQGAPADVFLSADEAEMEVVAKSGLIENNSRRDLLANTLAMIVPKDSNLTVREPADLAKGEFKRIALGDPETVPAGVYAREFLESKGVWSSLKSKIVPTENVRSALAAVASGNADAGIVYKTDALISEKVKVVYEVPASAGLKILYPVALTKDASDSGAARKFLHFLESPPAAGIFARYGFLPVR
jgi:molybdate transport system substrate-binding protein